MGRGIGRVVALAACGFVLATVTACGGGGGGSGDSSGGGGQGLSVTADKSALQFVGFAASLPRPQNINFTLVNAPAGSEYYGQIVPDVPGDFQATFTATSATTAVVGVSWIRPEALTRSGSITFKLCSDAACTKVAWTQSIPYTANVYSIAMDQQALTGYEGVASQPVNVAVTPTDTGNQLTVTATMGNGTGWLNATHATGANIAINTTAASLLKGSYQGFVRVAIAGQTDGPTINIPVAFTVGDGTIAPPGAMTDLAIGTTAAETAAVAPVTFRGVQAPAWTASSDKPWLVLTQAAGTGTGQVRYAIDPSKTDALPNWGSATATVKISAAGLSDVSFPVTLNKKLPEVYVASPGVVRTGADSTVRVTGRGLSQLASAGQIQVGALSSITGSITSDTSATLTLPALQAGRLTLSIPNALGVSTSSAAVGAAPASALTAAFVNATGEKRSSLFDPTRNAVYAVNWTQNTLVRFMLTNGQWQIAGLPVAGIGDMAMAPDRRTIYVTSGASTLLAVDPDTLQVRSSYTVPASQIDSSLSTGMGRTRGLPVTGNLRLWFSGNQSSSMRYFDMLSSSFGVLQANTGFGSFYSPSFYASGDGSTMLVGQGSLSPPLPGYVYSTATDMVVSTPNVPQLYMHAIYSEDGSRVLVDNTTLYKASDFSLIGSLPKTSGIGTTALLSPDGRRVYRMITANMNSLLVDHIDVYDATQVNPSSSELLKLGEITLLGQGASCGNESICDPVGSFIISPLGDTLFWTGNKALVVIPIPSSMSSLQASTPRLRPAATR